MGIENFYDIAETWGDTVHPKVIFSEFGLTDFGSNDKYYGNLKGNMSSLGEVSDIVFGSIVSNLSELSFSDVLSIQAFRMIDFSESRDVSTLDESNFGMIEVNGTIKPIFETYFEIINGEAYTDQFSQILGTPVG